MAGLDVEQVERRAVELSEEFNHLYLGTEHAFLAVLADEPYLAEVLAGWNLSPKVLSEAILKIAERGERPQPWKGILRSPRWGRVKQQAESEARDAGATGIQSQHVIAAILREGRGIPARVLSAMEVDLLKLRGEVLVAGSGNDASRRAMSDEAAHARVEEVRGRAAPGSRGHTDEPSREGRAKPENKGKTTLGEYARNLTDLARDGRLDPVIGRNEEIRRCLQILTRKGKNNPVLIGESGVGKSSVVYGLAQRIANGRVPDMMKNKALWEVSMTRLVAGAAYKGEFQERLQKLMDEVLETPDVIVFIDEMHMLMGAGDHKGGMDAGNILKPALARGEFPVIGATTTDEYRRTIETDAALERRFQPVMVNEPSDQECLAILEGLRPRYEAHHGVKIHDRALLAAVKLSTRYITERHLPDKAIDLVDEAAARVKLAATSKSMITNGPPRFEVIEDDIAEVVSHYSGIPVTRLTSEESERLLDIEQALRRRVLGQDDAIKAVARTIRVMRMGLGNPSRPGGVFLFLGPTGVGKTELARALAEVLFDGEKDLIRLDMSEYMEKHAVARMIGSPPGYVGHEEEGQLTSAVRKKPYSVVLLDEIEKAHPDIFDLFLQVFEDGRLTDSHGRTVNFTNTIIILTSNIGTRADVASDPDDPELVAFMHEELRKKFRLELINRFDDIVIFRSLSEAALEGIVDLQLNEFARRVREQLKIMLAVGADARALLLRHGYSPSMGARPLKRAVQSLLVQPLAETMLRSQFHAGDLVRVREERGNLVFVKEDLDEERAVPCRGPDNAANVSAAPVVQNGVSHESIPEEDHAVEKIPASAPDHSEPRRAIMDAPTSPSDLGTDLETGVPSRAASTVGDDEDLKATVPRRRPAAHGADASRRGRKRTSGADEFWKDLGP